jgi:nucleotide-binding universal stress UspA family protein
MIERILMPLDGSTASAHALPFGLTLARACHAELTLLHVVVDPRAVFYALPPGVPYTPELASDLERAGRALLAAAAAKAGAAGVAARTQLAYDDRPARAILAAETAHDLTILGSHGRRGLDRFFLGSATQEVLRRAEGPCLVVRVPNETRAGAHNAGPCGSAPPLGHLLIACDGSPCSEAALIHGFALAQALRARVTLLHALEPPASALDRAAAADLLTHAAARAEAVGVAATVALLEGEAGEIILAAERRADLTVMGGCGPATRGLARLGSVTERLLRSSATPRLVVCRSAQRAGGGRAGLTRCAL